MALTSTMIGCGQEIRKMDSPILFEVVVAHSADEFQKDKGSKTKLEIQILQSIFGA